MMLFYFLLFSSRLRICPWEPRVRPGNAGSAQGSSRKNLPGLLPQRSRPHLPLPGRAATRRSALGAGICNGKAFEGDGGLQGRGFAGSGVCARLWFAEHWVSVASGRKWGRLGCSLSPENHQPGLGKEGRWGEGFTAWCWHEMLQSPGWIPCSGHCPGGPACPREALHFGLASCRGCHGCPLPGVCSSTGHCVGI